MTAGQAPDTEGLFERFLDTARSDMPDIDTNFVSLRHERNRLAEWLYGRAGGIFWRGETTWQDRHRAEADQWFAYADLLSQLAPVEQGNAAAPDYDQIMSAVGARFWHLAGPDLEKFGHRDLVFGTTWQDAMWAVTQGVRDAYGIEGIAGCEECEAIDATCPEHAGHHLLKTPSTPKDPR